TGAACLPAARTTVWASRQSPPAPPRASATSGSVRPPSSSAVHSLSGQAPFSADSISSLVTRSLKSRVIVSESSVPSSLMLISLRGGPRDGPPHPPALGTPRGTRGAPRSPAASFSPEPQPAGGDAGQ